MEKACYEYIMNMFSPLVPAPQDFRESNDVGAFGWNGSRAGQGIDGRREGASSKSRQEAHQLVRFCIRVVLSRPRFHQSLTCKLDVDLPGEKVDLAVLNAQC